MPALELRQHSLEAELVKFVEGMLHVVRSWVSHFRLAATMEGVGFRARGSQRCQCLL